MKLPMSWLKEYVDIENITLKEYIDRITMSGTKVENFVNIGHDIKNVVVGKVLSVKNHPNADKLVVCQTDVGDKIVQIVTGAENVFEGAYVPVALDGAVLINDFKITKSELRGVISDGMFCSVEEFGFTTHDYPEAPEDGIYIFENKEKLGADVLEILEMRDEVVEFEITSNRPDCFSILGLARESSATFEKEFKYPVVSVKEKAGENASDYIKVDIENSGSCFRYVARVIKNVKIAPSPLWMRHRLTMCGIRPINNMVDITNYVMLEYGQPMHSFDIDPVKGGHIIVKNAIDGEEFTTLDGNVRKLDSSMLVISDSEKTLAIAGIMGGENSKVSENAKAVLLESANFDSTSIRISSKKLGLRTDSSSKFEKGIDPNLAKEAIDRAVQLIELLGCGEVVSGYVDCYPVKRNPWTVNYSPERINKLLGTNISSNEMVDILKRLDIDVTENTASIKTYRNDLKIEADIAEEIARIYGYDKIKSTLATGSIPTVGKKTKKQVIESLIKDTMASEGLFEMMSYSFESPKVFDKLMVSEDDNLRKYISILNPLGEDYSAMRTTTVNGMLESLARNYNRRNESAKLFEFSFVYVADELPLKKLPKEKQVLTIGMYGGVDFYDIKGILEVLENELGITNIEYTNTKEYNFMHPGRTAKITHGEKEIGFVGEIHPLTAENYEIKARTYIAILDGDYLIEHTNLERIFKELPKFPSMERDISMIINDEIPVKKIEDIISHNGGSFLEKIKLFDIYKGEQVEEGFKSVAYNVSFRSKDRTLKEDEISKQMEQILERLKEELGAKLR